MGLREHESSRRLLRGLAADAFDDFGAFALVPPVDGNLIAIPKGEPDTIALDLGGEIDHELRQLRVPWIHEVLPGGA